MQYLADMHRPFSLCIELENDESNTFDYIPEQPQTRLAFVLQGKNMQHSVVLYRFLGVDQPGNYARFLPIQGQLIHSLKQMRTRYLAVSLDKELRFYDIVTLTLQRTINTEQPYQFLVRASPRDFQFELGMVSEACIGYGYKTFFECGATITQGTLEDFQYQALQEVEAQRKKTVFKIEGMPNAIIS